MSSPRIFQSTRPIRGATHHGQRLGREVPISIHAPHTGRDWRSSGDRLMTKISIHAPHTGRDVAVQESRYGVLLFQSTRPIRGATLHDNSCCFLAGYFNPRAPYGARQGIDRLGDPTSTFQSTRPIRGATADTWRQLHDLHISIHAPHTGRDARHGLTAEITITFQSTRPIRGATPAAHASATNRADFNPRAPYGARRAFVAAHGDALEISIHAPHTGRDLASLRSQALLCHFNPRAPYGARRPSRCRCLHRGYFNPRAPYGARHTKNVLSLYSSSISIHAPHTGRDGAKHNYYICSNKFQSTRPIRGATHRRGRQALQDHISIHAPHTGRDLADKTVCATLNRISIHAPHTGRDWG